MKEFELVVDRYCANYVKNGQIMQDLSSKDDKSCMIISNEVKLSIIFYVKRPGRILISPFSEMILLEDFIPKEQTSQ